MNDGADGRRLARLRGRLRGAPLRTVLLPRGEMPPRAVLIRLALALVLAILLWAHVSDETDPVRTLAYNNVPVRPQLSGSYSLLTNLPTGSIRMEGLQSQVRDAATPRLFVDLTRVSSTAPQTVPVRIRDVPPGAQVGDYSPRSVVVRLEKEATRRGLPVEPAAFGQIPQGFNPPDFIVTPPTVAISGPSHLVASVSTVRLTNLNEGDYTQDTTLTATPQLFDRQGRSVGRGVVHISPPQVTVSVHVNRQPFQQLVPVTPIIRGSVAAGYGITSITVFPQFVQAVSSFPLATTTLATEPITVTGLTATHVYPVALVGPVGVTLNRTQAIVTIDVAPVAGSATTTAGALIVNKRPGTTVALDPPTIMVTYGGPLPALRAATVPRAVLDLANRPPGVYHLTPVIQLPVGLKVLALTPPSLRVVITAPPRPRLALPSPTAKPALTPIHGKRVPHPRPLSRAGEARWAVGRSRGTS